MITSVTNEVTVVTYYYFNLWILITLLCSFIYHYLKKSQYKGIIIGSIIIGAILGCIYGAIIGYLTILGMKIIEGIIPYGLIVFLSLLFIILGIIIALFGGLIAVTLIKIFRK